MHPKKYTTRFRLAVFGVVLALALLAAAAVLVFLAGHATLDPPPPAADPPPLAPLEMQPSRLVVPVSIPLATIGGKLNQVAPRNLRGTAEIVRNAEASWTITRSPIEVAGAENTLRISGALEGDVAIDAWAGSARLDLQARYRIASRPRIRPDWRLTPNLSMELSLDQARHRLFGLFDISLRSTIGPYVDRALRAQQDRLQQHIASDDSIEQAARELWARLCASVPISPDSTTWLEIRPVGISATQVQIDAEDVSLQLALHARTWIATQRTTPQCVFPDQLAVANVLPAPGSLVLWLPAEAGYGELRKTLGRQAVGLSFGDGLMATVDDVRLRPHGRSILLEVDLWVEAPGWFSGRKKVLSHLVAEPVLDAEAATLTLRNISIDTASSHLVAAALGEAGELRLLAWVRDRAVVDLSALQEQLRQQANEALAGLLGASPDSMALAAELDDLRLVRLDVGPDSMRAVARAVGTARVPMQKLALITPE